MKTVVYPTGGCIPNLAGTAEPGKLSAADRKWLRELAGTVAEIAAKPEQRVKRDLWYQHCRLERSRPMVLIFPEDAWFEIITEEQLRIADPFWRYWEWYLRHLIYRDQNFQDDFVIEPQLYVNKVTSRSDWGLDAEWISPEEETGASRWISPIKGPDDIARLKYPEISVDQTATDRQVEALTEVFSDLLSVKVHCALPIMDVADTAAYLRGIEQVMWDMYDRPDWLHELMGFVSEGIFRMAKSLQEGGHLTLNNQGHYNDSGGISYSEELPAKDFDGEKVRFCDLWGFSPAQAASEVGPDQHEEFILRYDLRLLRECGLNAYGCCEPYTRKFEMLKRNVPRLRRVSVSPWCDIEKAAEALEDKYIYSWKPNPAIILSTFDTESIRSYVRRTLEVAKDCVLEIIHKDTPTVRNEPQRLITWGNIVREEIDRIF